MPINPRIVELQHASGCTILFPVVYRLNAAGRPKVATFMGKTNESTSSTKRQPSVRKKSVKMKDCVMSVLIVITPREEQEKIT